MNMNMVSSSIFHEWLHAIIIKLSHFRSVRSIIWKRKSVFKTAKTIKHNTSRVWTIRKILVSVSLRLIITSLESSKWSASTCFTVISHLRRGKPQDSNRNLFKIPRCMKKAIKHNEYRLAYTVFAFWNALL